VGGDAQVPISIRRSWLITAIKKEAIVEPVAIEQELESNIGDWWRIPMTGRKKGPPSERPSGRYQKRRPILQTRQGSNSDINTPDRRYRHAPTTQNRLFARSEPMPLAKLRPIGRRDGAQSG